MIEKEEQKQHLIDIMKGDVELGLYELGQEVFETPITMFIHGAQWQAPRIYGEEEVIELIQFLSMSEEFNGYGSVSKETAKYYLEQFKKQ